MDGMNFKNPEGPPPFDGEWKKREDVEGGLDAAKSLEDIAYFSSTRGDGFGWNTGLTSTAPQYWVRVPDSTP